MIDLSSIYRNPRIPGGYYYCKVTDIDIEELGQSRPRIGVTLRIGPMHEQAGTHLHSIIHATDAAIYYFKNFKATFGIRSNRYHEAIGQWGCIEVHDAQHGKTKYSALKWVYQPHNIRMRTHEISQEEANGLLDWGEHETSAVTPPEPVQTTPRRTTAHTRRGSPQRIHWLFLGKPRPTSRRSTSGCTADLVIPSERIERTLSSASPSSRSRSPA